MPFHLRRGPGVVCAFDNDTPPGAPYRVSDSIHCMGNCGSKGTDTTAMTVTQETTTAASAVPKVCSYLETVGRTPMVKLDRCVPPESKQATILCKLEMQNPGGSLKDRIALNMIEEAEKRGEITPGKTTIVDFTSGNTGIGYSMVAAAKGYKSIIVMPAVRPMLERYLICRQFGAVVHLFNPSLGAPGGIKYIKDLLAANPDYWWGNQLGNMDNPAAHIANTGPEIWEQAEGKVDYFVHGIGTGGCIAGVGKFLKSKNADCKVIALEPSESRVHIGEKPGPHGIVGWAPGVHSEFLEGHALPKDQLSDAPRGVVDEWVHRTHRPTARGQRAFATATIFVCPRWPGRDALPGGVTCLLARPFRAHRAMLSRRMRSPPASK